MASRALNRSFSQLHKTATFHRPSRKDACRNGASFYTTSHHQHSHDKLTKGKATLSYAHATSRTSLVPWTVGETLERTVEKVPDRECLVFCETGIRRTFAQLSDEVDNLAAAFLKLGFKQGDRVGIWGPSTLEWILTQFATGKIGVILVNINPAYQTREMEYVLRKVGCRGLVTAARFKTQNYYNMICEVAPEIRQSHPGKLKSKRLPELTDVIIMGDEEFPGTYKFDDVIKMGGPADVAAAYNIRRQLLFDDPINIQFTSGTTGHPKGATLSHHGIVNNALLIGERMGFHQDVDRILCQVPLYHCFGMVAGALCMAVHGAANIFPVAGYDPAATVEALRQENCTTIYGTPTMFIDVMSHAKKLNYQYPTLKKGVMAGSPCPSEVVVQADAILGTKIQSLTINGNNLSDIISGTFRGLSSADTVDLSSNYIRTIHEGSFLGLDSARELKLNFNEIISLGDYVFRGLTSLEDLVLQWNNITYISPLAFKDLNRLTSLNLKQNRITEIPTKSLKTLPRLTILYLGKNPISTIDRKSLKGLRSLLVLWLEGCQIRTVAKRAFNGKSLQTLVLERNQLTRLPNLGKMEELEMLRLDGNPWVCDRNAEAMLTWLLRQNMVDNTVTCVEPASRRGQNLLSFSIEELIRDENIQNNNLTSLSTSTSKDFNTFKPSHLTASTAIYQNLISLNSSSTKTTYFTSNETNFSTQSDPLTRDVGESSAFVAATERDDRMTGDTSFTSSTVALTSDVNIETSDGEETEHSIKLPVLIVVAGISALVGLMLLIFVIRKVIIECNRSRTDPNVELTGRSKTASFQQTKRSQMPTPDPRNGCRLKRQLNGKRRRPEVSNQSQVNCEDCVIVNEQSRENGDGKALVRSCEL